MNLSKSLILMGIKHSGKSTQGRALALAFNAEFYDTDDVIKKLTNKTPREIYNSQGKEAFLNAEKLACEHVHSVLKEKQIVVATGGGICENPDALKYLSTNSTFIYLKIEESLTAERIIKEIKTASDKETILDSSTLPSYIAKKSPKTISDVKKIFHDFYTERTKKYSSLADITIKQKKLLPEEITKLIIQSL